MIFLQKYYFSVELFAVVRRFYLGFREKYSLLADQFQQGFCCWFQADFPCRDFLKNCQFQKLRFAKYSQIHLSRKPL